MWPPVVLTVMGGALTGLPSRPHYDLSNTCTYVGVPLKYKGEVTISTHSDVRTVSINCVVAPRTYTGAVKVNIYSVRCKSHWYVIII